MPSNQALVSIALAMCVGVVLWVYWDWSSASAAAELAIDRRVQSQNLIQKIRLLKREQSEAIRLVPKDVDPAPTVLSCIEKSGLKYQRQFTASPTKLLSVEGTSIREWKLSIPPLTGSLSQLEKFVRLLNECDFDLQLSSITMSSISQQPSGPEMWKYELEIHYLRM